MTDFSQSLQLGETTLDALERQLSNTITPLTSRSSRSKPVKPQSSEEVVEDSPTNVKCPAELSRQRSVRERLQILSTQSRTRKTSTRVSKQSIASGRQKRDQPDQTHENILRSPSGEKEVFKQDLPLECQKQKRNGQIQTGSVSLKRPLPSNQHEKNDGPSPEKLFNGISNNQYDDLFEGSSFSIDTPRSQEGNEGSYHTLFDQSNFTLERYDTRQKMPDTLVPKPNSASVATLSLCESEPQIFSETIFDRAISSQLMLEEANDSSGLEESLRIDETLDDTIGDVQLNIENVTFSQPLGDGEPDLYQQNQHDQVQTWQSSVLPDFIGSDMRCVTKEETLTKIRDANSSAVFSETINRTTSANKASTANVVKQNRSTSLSFDQTKNLRLLTSWGLPSSVTDEYAKKGIVDLFQWQVDCLSRKEVLLEGKNLVYSAPTSAGKTLVSEFLMVKTITERKLKALLILPFVAVAREKMLYLRDLLVPGGMRVEGFYGGYHPPGGFDSIDLAVCTIEKANSIVNRLLEQSNLASLGLVVVDEVHLISDPSRGYILELLLAKIRFVAKQNELRVQIVCMSATLPNMDLLARWLEADLFHTDFRPIALVEMIKIGNTIYSTGEECFQPLRELDGTLLGCPIPKDPDHVTVLCLETICEGCSVIVFCPSKDWCEKLAISLATTLHSLLKENMHSELSERVKEQLDVERQEEVLLQLRNCPGGLDSVLEKTITYGVAFHHAGLTTDERDIIEGSFRDGALRIIVATSTLSSGVNLPARRVIVRTPKFGGRPMSALTYKQMIGRAGRKGRDTLGESVLICALAEKNIGRQLVEAKLPPVRSCLDTDNYSHLKRAVLEIIASGSACTTKDLESFVNATLYSCEKAYRFEIDDQLLLRSKQILKEPRKPTPDGGDGADTVGSDPIATCIEFLLEYEFIRLQDGMESNENGDKKIHLSATRLGLACLAGSLPPKDGFLLFSELQKARQCFVLESELHAVYLVTPYSVAYQWQQIDWMDFLDLWEKLPAASRRVGELVGVKESFMVRAMRGTGNLDYRALQIHKRFYTALALLELVNEVPLCSVARKFKCCRGLLQSLQQISGTFAGIVASFCHALNWTLVQLIVGQFRERLFFGVAHELLDLMRIPSLNGQRARLLYDGGISGLTVLANADRLAVEKILYNRTSFEAERLREDENEFDAARRKNQRNLYLTGRAGMTVEEAGQLLIQEARTFLQLEHGLENPNWAIENTIAEKGNHPHSTSSFPITSHHAQQQEKPDQSTSSVLSRIETSTDCTGKFHNSLLMADPSTMTNENRHLIQIADVCEDRCVYEQFIKTVTDCDCLSISFGLARDESIQSADTEDLHIGSHLLKKLPQAAKVFYDRPSKRLFAFESNLYVAGVAITVGKEILTDEAICNRVVYYIDLQNEKVIDGDEKRQFLHSLLNRAKLTVTLLDAKEQLKAIYRAGLLLNYGNWEEVLATVQDPRIACWLMQTEEKTLTLDAMIERHCPELKKMEHRLTGQRWLTPKWTGHGMNYHSPIEAKKRCAVECLLVSYLIEPILERLAGCGGESLRTCFLSREMPVQLALARAEVDGFPVDRQQLGMLITRLKSCRDRIAQEACKLNGNRKLDFGSSRAVAIALRLASTSDLRKRFRTTRQVLERLESPLAALIIAHRKIESNLSRTIEPLYRAICPRTGRIHGRSHCFTSTGRITMHEPNLQTVVKDFDVPCMAGVEHFSCRSTFSCSDPGMVLLSADFCQLELCILTHLSQDRQLMTALGGQLIGKRDVFRSLAARWNQLELETHVSEDLRNRTKAIVYGVIYGMGVRSMAAELHVDEDAGKMLMDQFHATFPEIRRYTERVIRLTRQLGYIETLTGRRRYLPAINSTDTAERAEAERQAVCTTIQGSAADILKNAIVRMARNLRKYSDVLDLSAIRLVLHLHDELIYEVPRTQLPKVAKILKSSMQNCAKLSVPLRVKLKAGTSWGKLEEWSL